MASTTSFLCRWTLQTLFQLRFFFCLRQLSSTLAEQSNSACNDRMRARHFSLKKASPVVPKNTFSSPVCLIVLMIDAAVTWKAEFQYVFGCRSLSVGSCARVFIAESDSFYALHACMEGVQMVAIETVTTQTSRFVSSTGTATSSLDHLKI